MCVGEVVHLHVLARIISDFLHMQHSMFGSCTVNVPVFPSVCSAQAGDGRTSTWRETGTKQNSSDKLILIYKIEDCTIKKEPKIKMHEIAVLYQTKEDPAN